MPTKTSTKAAAGKARALLPLLRDLTFPRPPWLDDVLVPWRICAQRILVVTDGGLDFNETNGFGLTQFLLALETARPDSLAPIIHIAHRSNISTTASAAMKAKFTFHQGFTFTTSGAAPALMNGGSRNFDQLWVFGITDTAISDAEVRAINAFMAARGGVFATGDHETLGRGISGRLPRVRKMRNWSGIPMGGMSRIDTVNEPSPDGTWQFNSQSDVRPQRIYPHFEETAPSVYAAHRLLRYGAGSSFQTNVIDVLPDHPHESECLTGGNLSAPYDGGVSGIPALEFPPLPLATAPFSPQIVAASVSGGRIIEKGPVAPRCFGAISAYDGHRVNLGRIVCDATWHHFVNVNLDGTGSMPAGLRHGLQDEIPGTPPTYTPNAAYLKIKQYYRNIAEWLGPVRRCWWWLDLVVLRFSYPLLEELPPWPPVPPIPPEPDWRRLVEIGSLVEAAIDARDGRGSAADGVRDLLLGDALGLRLVGDDAVGDDTRAGLLVPVAEARRGVLGAVAHGVFSTLPDNAWALAAHFSKVKNLDAEADRLISSGLKRGVESARAHYAAAAKETLAVLTRQATR